MWTAVTLLICAFHPNFHGHELQHECHEQIFGLLLWRLKRQLDFQLVSRFVTFVPTLLHVPGFQALWGVACIPIALPGIIGSSLDSSFSFLLFSSHISLHLNFKSLYPLSSCSQGSSTALQLGASKFRTWVPYSLT